MKIEILLPDQGEIGEVELPETTEQIRLAVCYDEYMNLTLKVFSYRHGNGATHLADFLI